MTQTTTITLEIMLKTSDLIHIWQVNLAKLFTLTSAFDCLDGHEQYRATRFIFERHRHRFIAAHYALRQILQRYLHVDAEKIMFTVNQFGKPSIHHSQNPLSLEFNLSHSKEMALIALRCQKPVGVDVEFASARDFLGIARHSFSEKEVQELLNLDDEQQTQAFFHIWAQKEAFIKAVGKGLSYPLKDFSVAAFPPAALLEIKNDDVAKWFIHSFTPVQGAFAAVAAMGKIREIEYFDFG